MLSVIFRDPPTLSSYLGEERGPGAAADIRSANGRARGKSNGPARFKVVALLITLMLNAKKGLSAMQAARDLDMRRPTVWSMMHAHSRRDAGRRPLAQWGIVEMDEAYVGGKPRKRNRRDDDTPSPRGRGTSKTPIVGAVERGGRVKAKMVPMTK